MFACLLLLKSSLGIEAILRSVGTIMMENGIEVFKWAGGCTLVQQPADCADTHKNLHKQAQTDTVTYDEYGAPTQEMQQFIDFFQTLGPQGSRLITHTKFLRHFEWLVDSCWLKRTITEGFRLPGIWPFDAARILSGWAGWKYLPTEVAEEVVRLCTDVEGDAFQEVVANKLLDDLTAETIFGHLMEDDDLAAFKKDKGWDATPSNQRCVMITSKLFDDGCTFLQRELAQRKALEARLLAARGDIINGIQHCVCGSKLPNNVEKHLGTKLHETGCRKKGIWPAATGADAAPAEEAAPQTPPQAPLIRDVGEVQVRSRHRSRLQAMHVERDGRVQYGYRPGEGAFFQDGDESAAYEDAW